MFHCLIISFCCAISVTFVLFGTCALQGGDMCPSGKACNVHYQLKDFKPICLFQDYCQSSIILRKYEMFLDCTRVENFFINYLHLDVFMPKNSAYVTRLLLQLEYSWIFFITICKMQLNANKIKLSQIFSIEKYRNYVMETDIL